MWSFPKGERYVLSYSCLHRIWDLCIEPIIATDVEGIFRLSGSSKRIKDLQQIFDSPDRYGKGLDWTGYTVHDAANILRRYLNQLPEPIIPLEFYERFRDPLRHHQHQAVGDMEAQAQDVGDFNHEEAIATYQRLITEMPPLNRQLLLYILDLLAVFSSKSDLNRMTSPNLAAIFQPGMLSHPSHDMAPKEYRLSQDVLDFLIENQDSFLIGMTGTAADEHTVREVQSGAPSPQATTPTTNGPTVSKAAIGRSASNASAGADSLRKFGGVRRNVSVSSKHSKNSTNVSSPITPSGGTPYANNNTGSGVHRSNTLPSKKSPGLSSTGRFNKPLEALTPTSSRLAPPNFIKEDAQMSSPEQASVLVPSWQRSLSATSSITPTAEQPSQIDPNLSSAASATANERSFSAQKLHPPSLPVSVEGQPPSITPTKERKVSNFFSKSPTSDGERRESRQPNKLKKKRVPGTNQSAHSSTNSLHAGPVVPDSPATPPFHTPLPTPGIGNEPRLDPLASVVSGTSDTEATPTIEVPPRTLDGTHEAETPRLADPNLQHHSDATLKPAESPPPSVDSHSSMTDQSDFDQMDNSVTKTDKKEKRHRWRLSSAHKSHDHVNVGPVASGSDLGSNSGAAFSSSSIGSSHRPRKSITDDSQQLGTVPSSTGFPATSPTSGNDAGFGKEKEVTPESEKKGPIGWLKAKVQQAKEDRKEREAEKERAKSPPRNGAEKVGSRASLSAVAQEGQPLRGRSTDTKMDEIVEKGGQPPLPNSITPSQ